MISLQTPFLKSGEVQRAKKISFSSLPFPCIPNSFLFSSFLSSSKFFYFPLFSSLVSFHSLSLHPYVSKQGLRSHFHKPNSQWDCTYKLWHHKCVVWKNRIIVAHSKNAILVSKLAFCCCTTCIINGIP